jgi:hypothetical protein
MNIGKILLAYREKNKISLRQMAAQIPAPATSLFRLETGKDINAKTFGKILAWMLRND